MKLMPRARLRRLILPQVQQVADPAPGVPDRAGAEEGLAEFHLWKLPTAQTALAGLTSTHPRRSNLPKP